MRPYLYLLCLWVSADGLFLIVEGCAVRWSNNVKLHTLKDILLHILFYIQAFVGLDSDLQSTNTVCKVQKFV